MPEPDERLPEAPRGLALRREELGADLWMKWYGCDGTSTLWKPRAPRCYEPAAKYLRDARVMTLYVGTSQIQKLLIGRAETGISPFV